MVITHGRNRTSKPSRLVWPVGAKPRLAMSIMLYLGVRRSDAVLIGKKHENRDELSVTFAQFKGAEEGGQATHASDPAATSRDPQRERAWKRDLVGNSLRQAAQLERLWQHVQELVREGGTAPMQLPWLAQNRYRPRR